MLRSLNKVQARSRQDLDRGLPQLAAADLKAQTRVFLILEARAEVLAQV
jgi:hypothetical protein